MKIITAMIQMFMLNKVASELENIEGFSGIVTPDSRPGRSSRRTSAPRNRQR